MLSNRTANLDPGKKTSNSDLESRGSHRTQTNSLNRIESISIEIRRSKNFEIQMNSITKLKIEIGKKKSTEIYFCSFFDLWNSNKLENRKGKLKNIQFLKDPRIPLYCLLLSLPMSHSRFSFVLWVENPRCSPCFLLLLCVCVCVFGWSARVVEQGAWAGGFWYFLEMVSGKDGELGGWAFGFEYLPLEKGFKKKGLAVLVYFWRGGAGFVKSGVWWAAEGFRVFSRVFW